MWCFSPGVVFFVVFIARSPNHHKYLWWFVWQFHHKSKSPQVFVVFIDRGWSKVRKDYESIAGGVDMFDGMCTWYLEYFYKY